jgi:hypothetical protein
MKFGISFQNNMDNLKKQLLVLPRTTVRGYENAARLRGEKEDVVFTSCSSCFQLNLEFQHVLHGSTLIS